MINILQETCLIFFRMQYRLVSVFGKRWTHDLKVAGSILRGDNKLLVARVKAGE